VTVKLFALVAVLAVTPGGGVVVTWIFPVFPFFGTIAVILVVEPTLYVAVTPPISTAVVPIRSLPVIVTVVPVLPLVGVKLVIEGFSVAARAEPASTHTTAIIMAALSTPLYLLRIIILSL
jgi:hypothetical protein